MKAVYVTGRGTNGWVDVPTPEVGPDDVLLEVKACGICGSDAMYTMYGGIPPRQGATPLGHEPAGEVVEVGANVTGVRVGDHVVPNPMMAPSGIIGSGGAYGALAEYLLIEQAEPGVTLRVIPDHVPWEVAALNEPMAVAHHAVNRSGAKEGDTAVVFGAGPIGLGAVISLKSKGVPHVVVVDLIPSRLEKALRVGADAVIDSGEEDVVSRLCEIHGEIPARPGHPPKAGTDVYIDAAGAAAVVQTALSAAKHGSVLTVVATHKRPVEVDFGEILGAELDIRTSMGYPTEIFEVTDAIIEHWEKYAVIVSDELPFDQTLDALSLAATPGAADKVMVTFGER
ncbi:zinc-binding dehydrogenase [Microbacterium sp. 18062]|uniref:zinc-dependent alcohol dehydrogenase n=1 Tax=Microbacterium sp. 18062 TaxID=2681410 RepID=UPI00135AE0E1|nr:zinc-binding dehydrogenase [Microbacterium sp. 18062]